MRRIKGIMPLVSVFLAVMALTGCTDGADTVTNPAPPNVDPSSATVVSSAAPEGPSGSLSMLEFRVSLTEPQPESVFIQYNTEAGSASADDDFLPIAGELEILAGDVIGKIVVELIGDSNPELAETLILNVTASENASLTAHSAVGTIANDDTSCDKPFSKDPNPWIRNGADPLNIAHRGGVTDFPENTLYAYSQAALASADVLEMDVYQTKDDELVILHDLDVDRTTNGQGNVVDLTLAELRELDAAYWFVPGEGTPHDREPEDYVFRGIATGAVPPPDGYSAEDFRIPTLEEALRRFPANLMNLELKPDLDGEGNYERQMADLLQRYGRFTDVIAVSFVDEAANNFKAIAPCVYTAVPLGQGTGLVLQSKVGDLPEVPEHIAFQVPPDTSQIGPQIPGDEPIEVVNEDFIADSHAVNLAVQVWTINSCEDMLRMIDLGVDGIMTDQPLLLESLLAMPVDERSCE